VAGHVSTRGWTATSSLKPVQGKRRGSGFAAQTLQYPGLSPYPLDVGNQKLDRRLLERSARELQARYSAAFAERGGDLRVSAGMASNIRTRTKSLELSAAVEWRTSHIYDHIHAEVAERPWFSRRLRAVRSLEEAAEKIENKLREWLRNPS